MTETPKRGDIFFASLTKDGSVQGGTRPVLIIQNDIGNKNSPNVSVIPITSKQKAMYMPTHVVIQSGDDTGLDVDSTALVENILTIPKNRLLSRLGNISKVQLNRIQSAILVQFGMAG